MKDKRFHINTAQEIAAAWENGKPLAALCGYVRRMDRKRHEKRLKRVELEACADCVRIANALVSTGQSSGIQHFKSADEIEGIAASERMPKSAGNYNYSFTMSNPSTWTYK